MKKLAIVLAMLFCLALIGASAEEVAGGWTVTEDPAVTQEAAAALEKALQEYEDSGVDAVALLGTQVVAGTNYAILCRVGDPEDGEPFYAVLYIYEDLQGNCELVDLEDIDFESAWEDEGEWEEADWDDEGIEWNIEDEDEDEDD